MRLSLILLLLSFNVFAQSIIPKPTILEKKQGEFEINKATTFYIQTKNPELLDILHDVNSVLKNNSGFSLKNIDTQSANQIAYLFDYTLPLEAYVLNINPNGVEVKASSAVGFFYGTQSLLQLLPSSIHSTDEIKATLPALFIKDLPRFGYRGVMIDVCRHFYPASFIKKMIDVFAFYKINRLHWHLTDDQGWRIEIKKYPKLTEVGSIRKETAVGHYAANQFDGKPYGGFYTQEEIKDVVAYAQKKHITIIPEIEMPGHAMAALTAYPELGCTGGPYEVRTTWGVEDHIFCPKEETFEFLENVLLEVMELFPSKYIHIGGDEAPKTTWENSEFCKGLIKKEGLKDMHELQSYFIKRIDKFVTAHGRRIIGWDEILEGGLSPNATVMSWRGEDGGIEAAKMGHDVIMTPNSHFYLDYYQGAPVSEPLAIGGFVPLERVYSYEPFSDKLGTEQQKYILGLQGNLWTEYIKTSDHVEYMLFPRVLAVAEVSWSEKGKNYKDFIKRVKHHDDVLRFKGINASNSQYNIEFTTSKNDIGQTIVGLSTVGDGVIKYTTTGDDPTFSSNSYNDWIVVNKNVEIKAKLFSESGRELSKTTSKSFDVSKSMGLTYRLGSTPDKQFDPEKYILTDGQLGDANSYLQWAGFWGKDFNMEIDFGKIEDVTSISMAFLGNNTDWVFTPSEVEIHGSIDGKKFSILGKQQFPKMTNLTPHTMPVEFKLSKTKVKYIKVKAKNFGNLPEEHPSKGNPSWVFVDEISIK